jgi:hypothetical protein
METMDSPNVLKAKTASNAIVDLSAEIARTLAKRPGEKVKVTRVFGNHYRCNWIVLDRQPTDGAARQSMFIESFKIRDSRFLRATRGDSGLVIEDVTAETARKN